jgi:hypothetical protein
MIEPKYYFAFVRTNWTYYGGDKVPVSGGEDNEFQNVTDIHPLKWQIEYNKEHYMMPIETHEINETHGTYKYVTQKMTVISWHKLSVKEYNNFKDIINEE